MAGLRWTLAEALGVASVLFLVVLPIAMFLAARRHALRGESRSVSGVWLVGSSAGVLAVLVAPLEERRWLWAALPLAFEALTFVGLTITWRVSGLAKLRERNDDRRGHPRRPSGPR